MTKKMSQKLVAWVLWNAGHRSPAPMKRRGSIPERTARSYIADFRHEARLGEESISRERQSQKTRPKSSVKSSRRLNIESASTLLEKLELQSG